MLNAPYGAFELKHVYQKNMLMGTTFSALITALLILSVWLYNIITYHEIETPDIITIRTIVDIGPPPSVDAGQPQINIAKPKGRAPDVGIPTAITGDDIADEENYIPSRRELHDFNAPTFSGQEGNGSRIVIDIPPEDTVPDASEFVPLEKVPVLIYEAVPDYPRLAEEGGFTASVIVESFVGKDGNVKKARAVKTNRPNMGFEEAAVAAGRGGRVQMQVSSRHPERQSGRCLGDAYI